MEILTKLISEDMRPALGVTEPGAIAFAVAKACSLTEGVPTMVKLRLNSGMFKNAFTCGIAGTDKVGNYYAAALGLVAADPEKGLGCLDGITEENVNAAREMIDDGKITVEMSEITSRIFIEASVKTAKDHVTVTIQDSHTNIVRITKNNRVLLGRKSKEPQGKENVEEAGKPKMVPLIHNYTLQQLYDYAASVPFEEISFIAKAHQMNMNLFELGLASDQTTFSKFLYKENGGQVISKDEQKTASLLCNGAIEARVIGLPAPAMSITGSGAHGIIATLPLYANYKVNGRSEEELLRATALSYLICMYIKEYSGKLSAFCGCAIAAGTGMACGLVMLDRGTVVDMERTIQNMASSITGMICDGGNQGCTMKGVIAVDAAYRSVKMAMAGVSVDHIHGINSETPEDTMKNMGLIASPGMTGTEKTIIDILNAKAKNPTR